MKAVSRRIAAIVDLMEPCGLAADIACENARIAVCAVERNAAEYALACDISQAALDAAQKNIIAHGLTEKITTRLSDGLSRIKPREADAALVAGVGGPLIARFIAREPQTARGFSFLILAPQSAPFALRQALLAGGFMIADERLICEGGKFYPVIKARAGAEEAYTEAQLYFGKIGLSRKDPVLFEFIERRLAVLEALAQKRPAGFSPNAQTQKQILLLKEAKKTYFGGMP